MRMDSSIRLNINAGSGNEDDDRVNIGEVGQRSGGAIGQQESASKVEVIPEAKTQLNKNSSMNIP